MQVSLRAAELAAEMIRALPADLPRPEFAGDPDGSISLDWIHSKDRLFSLSAGKSRRLPYAWLDGEDSGHGVADFEGSTLPTAIIEGIRRAIGQPEA